MTTRVATERHFLLSAEKYKMPNKASRRREQTNRYLAMKTSRNACARCSKSHRKKSTVFFTIRLSTFL